MRNLDKVLNIFDKHSSCQECKQPDNKDNDILCDTCDQNFDNLIPEISSDNYFNSTFPIPVEKRYKIVPKIKSVDSITYNFKYKNLYIKSNLFSEQIEEVFDGEKEVWILKYHMFDYYLTMAKNGKFYTGTKTNYPPILTVGEKEPNMNNYHHAILMNENIRFDNEYKHFWLNCKLIALITDAYFKRKNCINLSDYKDISSNILNCNLIYYWN